MHGYVVQSRIGTLAWTTEITIKKKIYGSEVVSALGFERSGPGFDSQRPVISYLLFFFFLFHASNVYDLFTYFTIF